MNAYRFTRFDPSRFKRSRFERLLDIFQEMLVYTAGDVDEALDWLEQLAGEYDLFDDDYGLDDFVDELREKGYLKPTGGNGTGGGALTSRMEQLIRERSLEEIFGRLKRSGRGDHKTPHTGLGEEDSAEVRPYQFGDNLDRLSMTDSIRNAQINHGISEFRLEENDLEVRESEQAVRTSTVLMIDISHSMILYGEDRITPAKKVAMALSELIMRKYPKDSLDVLVFGNDAWPIEIRDLPYLEVGPYHTNTVAGLELAMDLLRRRKNPNKRIFMITDGKPTCIREGGEYYKNSFGLDPKILNKTLNLAGQCRRLGISVTTFMIARDPYLQQFVREFTEVNKGKAFYTSLKGLGEYLFEDYEKNRRRRMN